MSSFIKRFYGHLKTVLTHKYYVLKYCHKLGITWQGITHDLSKFSPVEFGESVRHWTGKISPLDTCKRHHNGLSYAWMHHKARNPHHYEYWLDSFDRGEPTPRMMPWKYVCEMVADYIAAGKTYSKNVGKEFTYANECEWFMDNRYETAPIHQDTKDAVLHMLSVLCAAEDMGMDTDKRFVWKVVITDKQKYIDKFNETYNKLS